MDKAEIQKAAKPFAWGLAVGAVGLSIVAFSLNWVVTTGTAETQLETSVEEARATLAATVCVDHFLASPDARAQLAALKESRSWERGDLIEEGGWVTLAGFKEPVPEAADLCADRLADMELPAKEKETAEAVDGDTTTVQ